jgi:aminoglycoside phosphotransferase (APT) family kinase protein
VSGDPAGASEIREEDRFDIAMVDGWLGEHAPGVRLSGPPQVRQFSGGASNLTYLLRYPERDLILRRPPAGTKAASAHDMAREFQIQRALRPTYRYVPEMIALCEDPAVIGSSFYVMERVKGTILRAHVPADLGLDERATRALCHAAVDRLVELHMLDPVSSGLGELDRGGGYVRRQIEGWSARYRAARTANVPKFTRVMAWLAERQPADVARCVVHNDFRLDNLVLSPTDPSQIVAVLDWEMATVGDPLMDLGGAMAYWVQADDDRVMQERYSKRTERQIEDWVFYEVFGLFRLAVIIQQIYRRYHLRQHRNPAPRHYWLAVYYLNRRCRGIIARSERASRSGASR